MHVGTLGANNSNLPVSRRRSRCGCAHQRSKAFRQCQRDALRHVTASTSGGGLNSRDKRALTSIEPLASSDSICFESPRSMPWRSSTTHHSWLSCGVKWKQTLGSKNVHVACEFEFITVLENPSIYAARQQQSRRQSGCGKPRCSCLLLDWLQNQTQSSSHCSSSEETNSMPSTSLPLESSAAFTPPLSSSSLITTTLSPGITVCTSVDFSFSSSSSSSALARGRFRSPSAFSLSLRFRHLSIFLCLNASHFTGSNLMFARRCLWTALTASRLRAL
jgi:hypothetical protein